MSSKTTQSGASKTCQPHIAHALDIYAKDTSADFLYREILTSFETMFSLVAPNRSTRSEASDAPSVPVTNVTTTDAFFEQSLQLARTESIQWRTLYQTHPESAHIPFLGFFAHTSTDTENASTGKSLLYRIVKLDTAHAAHAQANRIANTA